MPVAEVQCLIYGVDAFTMCLWDTSKLRYSSLLTLCTHSVPVCRTPSLSCDIGGLGSETPNKTLIS